MRSKLPILPDIEPTFHNHELCTFDRNKSILNPLATVFLPNDENNAADLMHPNLNVHSKMNLNPNAAVFSSRILNQEKTPRRSESFNSYSFLGSFNEGPDVIEVDTPNTSLMEIEDSKENVNMNMCCHFYIFVNSQEFSAYYFIFALSLIVVLSMILKPISEGESNEEISISLKGWSEITDFLTGQFTNVPEEIESSLTLEEVSTRVDVYKSWESR